MNINTKIVSAAQVLEFFKNALREGLKCGLIAPQEFEDSEENDREFLEKNMR